MKLEDAVEDEICLDAARVGNILWRNNVGEALNKQGNPVRFGLANTSKAVNKHTKSSDEIGITVVMVTPEMVGQLVGVFTAVEVKREGWVYAGTEREVAQANYHNIVRSYGGIAGFAASVNDYRELINRVYRHGPNRS